MEVGGKKPDKDKVRMIQSLLDAREQAQVGRREAEKLVKIGEDSLNGWENVLRKLAYMEELLRGEGHAAHIAHQTMMVGVSGGQGIGQQGSPDDEVEKMKRAAVSLKKGPKLRNKLLHKKWSQEEVNELWKQNKHCTDQGIAFSHEHASVVDNICGGQNCRTKDKCVAKLQQIRKKGGNGLYNVDEEDGSERESDGDEPKQHKASLAATFLRQSVEDSLDDSEESAKKKQKT